jgi:CubicO group peptidase (beta-lactamase class C family)
VSLDDSLATWFPDYPRAEQVTIKNLLNMTSGYADYVYQPALGDGLNQDPFRQWTNDELLAIGFAGPEQFAPGTNWGYSHTNYVILGQVLEKITGKPLAEVMQEYIIGPMNLTATGGNAGTPAIPFPVQHAFTAERAEYFGVTPTPKAYEEATFWNPSWTTANGAVQTTNIYDMTTSIEIVGSGSQVSPQMYAEQTNPNLVGFGSPDPTGVCTACRTNTTAGSYGLGVILLGPWITQTKSFAGAAASTGYLPSESLAVSVAMTYLPQAYADGGSLNTSSQATFDAVVEAVAPGKAPPKRP